MYNKHTILLTGVYAKKKKKKELSQNWRVSTGIKHLSQTLSGVTPKPGVNSEYWWVWSSIQNHIIKNIIKIKTNEYLYKTQLGGESHKASAMLVSTLVWSLSLHMISLIQCVSVLAMCKEWSPDPLVCSPLPHLHPFPLQTLLAKIYSSFIHSLLPTNVL